VNLNPDNRTAGDSGDPQRWISGSASNIKQRLP
jgi:hypothetical protein